LRFATEKLLPIQAIGWHLTGGGGAFCLASVLGSNQWWGLFAGRWRRLGTRLPAWRGTETPDFPTSGFFLPSTQRLA